MTISQIEDKMFELRSYIADKFRDIQMQSQALKNVEDEAKNRITLTKINDFVEEILRGYGELEALYHEEPDEETPDDNEYSKWGSYM